MSSYPAVSKVTGIAPGAVVANRAVGFNYAQAATQGQNVLGVSGHGAATGEAYPIDVLGPSEIESGGEFAAGAMLITDNQGRAIAAPALAIAAGGTAVTSTAANGSAIFTGGSLPVHVFAQAMQASTGAGQLIEIIIK
jgi:hypothetical protein